MTPNLNYKNELIAILAQLYPTVAASSYLAFRAGIDAGTFLGEQIPDTRWYFIVDEATKAGLLDRLLAEALADYPNYAALKLLASPLGISAAMAQTPHAHPPLLIVAIGDDAALRLDLASLRAVRKATSMEFHRIPHATLAKLKTALDRQRGKGLPANVHLAVHSGPQGVQLSGELIDADMLSEVLDGVLVLVLAGCEGSEIADFLGVVPNVVSFSEEITHTNAAAFSRLFWTEIGYGVEPPAALERALDLAPSGLREFVVTNF